MYILISTILVYLIPSALVLEFTPSEIAQTITTLAKSSNRDMGNQFICTTWIFPSLLHSIISSQAQVHHEFLMPVLLPSLKSKINSSEPAPFAYRNYEFQDEDFFHPVAFGPAQLGVNCAAVFLELSDSVSRDKFSTQSANNMIEQLIATKLVRPHKDYFIFILTEGQSSLGVENANSAFPELRYKYLVTMTQNSEEPLTLLNTCERLGERLPLFSRKCDSLITGRHFRITSTNFPSMVRADSASGPGSGFLYSMIQEAAPRHNFTFNVYLAGFNGATGFKKEDANGKLVWVGAIGELFSGEADISFATATTLDRFRVIDPTALHTWYTRVFYVKPPPIVSSWSAVLRPLDSTVWSSILVVCIFVLAPILYASVSVYFGHQKRSSKAPIFSRTQILFQVYASIFRILMTQSATVRRWTGFNMRFLIILWTVVCLVLETGYKSKLVTFLSFVEREDYPKTHIELASSATAGKYRLNFRYYGGAAYKHYKSSTYPVHKVIIGKSHLVNTSMDCLASVLMTNEGQLPWACLDYALSGDFTIYQNFTLPHSENSDGQSALFIKSTDSDHKYMVAWNFRKGSRWIESFNTVVLQFYAAGLYDYWVEADLIATRKGGLHWWNSIIDQSQTANSSSSSNSTSSPMLKLKMKIDQLLADLKNRGPNSLKIRNFKGMILICFIGFALSSVCFILEFIFLHVRSFRKSKKKQLSDFVMEMSTSNYNPTSAFHYTTQEAL